MTRKEEIFENAIKLMREKGYVGTSMRDIASSMNLEAASLYNHIREKEEILRKNCFDLATQLIDRLNEVLNSNDEPMEKLRKFIFNHVTLLTENKDAAHVFLHEWKHLSEPFFGRFLAMRDEYERGLKKILKDDDTNNRFENRTYRMVVITILSALNAIESWYDVNGEMKVDELCMHLNDILIKGIKEKV